MTPTATQTDVLEPPELAPASASSPLRARRSRLVPRSGADALRTLLPITALVAMIVYFSFAASSFLSTANLTLMSGEAGILLLSALGATLVIVMGSVDLAVGSTVLVTGAIVSKVLAGGSVGVVLVVALAIGIGIAVGLLNGIVFAYGRVPSFITTLGSLSLLSGLGLLIMNGESISFNDQHVFDLATGQWIPNVQNAAVIALVVFGIAWFISRRTRFGLYLYALGGNEPVVALAGVKVNRIKVLAMIASGVTAALAGLLLMAELGSGGPTLGSSTLLDSVAAIVIGGTALSGGVGGVERTLLGVLILTVLSDGLNQLGVQTYTQTVIKGAVIIGAAVIAMASQRKAVIK
jgi:ribose transport system permease protein